MNPERLLHSSAFEERIKREHFDKVLSAMHTLGYSYETSEGRSGTNAFELVFHGNNVSDGTTLEVHFIKRKDTST
jgi:hypothetical protein